MENLIAYADELVSTAYETVVDRWRDIKKHVFYHEGQLI
jgi:hypothetical protein